MQASIACIRKDIYIKSFDTKLVQHMQKFGRVFLQQLVCSTDVNHDINAGSGQPFHVMAPAGKLNNPAKAYVKVEGSSYFRRFIE